MPGGDFRDSVLQSTASAADAQAGEHQTKEGSGDAITDFAAGAWANFKYSLVQAPLTGATQLVDKVAGTSWEKSTKFFDRPAHAEFGSAGWVGEAVGGTAGAALPFILMARVAGPGAASKMEQSAHYSLASKEAVFPILKSIGAGVAYSGIFTPVEQGEDFLSARARNMAVGGLTWGSLTATSVGLKGLGLRTFNQTAIAEAQGLTPAAKYTEGLFANSTVRSVLKNDVFNGAAGGIVGGIVDVQGRSILSGKGIASAGDTMQGAATFALGGALMGGTNILYEKVRPTSGDRRYRTLEDITKLADSTRDPSAPPRYHYDNLAAQEGIAISGRHEHMTTLKGMIEQSRLPHGEQGKVLRAHHDLVNGLEAVHDHGPVGVMYGSARTKSDTFAYQRGRLTSALVAKEGYPMMTGGGPGMMEAGNRGAYEAGGRSIGVSLELPHEPIGNGYQTTILSAKDFGPRKEILRTHDFAIVEKGGIGSVDEMAELLTHLQTGMKQKTPVYIMYEKPYKHFDRMMAEMEKQGLISKGDRDLYKIVKSPFEIAADLRARREAGLLRPGTNKPMISQPIGS